MPTGGADDRLPARTRTPALFSRLPIRVRLTLIFAAAMVFVLAISGVVVFQRVRSEVEDRARRAQLEGLDAARRSDADDGQP